MFMKKIIFLKDTLIILFVFTINYTNKLPKILWLNGIMSTLIMTYLDKYWEKKCDKVINKYMKK